ncbi:MAG: universal stress protein [Dehalococcoidia bacterium]|jgi:nucleotide-binding universal stress UspA family protein|nr:universal stress protein [Dehalococcoidia bacterium]
MYQKILLPLDGSDLSHQAIPHAIAVATGIDSEVTLLQVIDSVAHIISETTPATIEPVPSGELTVEIAESAVQAQREAAEVNLATATAQIVAGGIDAARISTEVVEGNASQAIEGAVERLGCDLVIIATHGRSGIKRVLLGSVADHVARNTPGAAVLLIRPQ